MPRLLPTAAGAALAAVALTAAPASAATEQVDRTLAELGTTGLALRGPSPVAAVDLALPARYAKAGGTLTLDYEGSPLLARSSTLEAAVNGSPVTAAQVGPGRHTLRIPLPRGVVDGADQQLTLTGRLRLKGLQCPPPDAPGLYLRVSGGSRLRLDATLASTPLALSALPAALDQRLGATAPPVTVAFHQPPSGAAVQAAGFAVGQVARATGYPGVRTVVVLPGQRVTPAPGSIRVMLTERPGAPAVAAARRADGGVDVRLAGDGTGLTTAASALTGRVAATLTGDRSEQLTAWTPDDRPRAIPPALPVSSASATGLGKVEATAGFRVPEWLELDRGARLQTRIAWSSPFGGQLRTLVNGLAGDQRRLGVDGRAQLTLDQLLAGAGPQAVRGEVRTGDNTVTAAGNLAAGAAGTCLPLDAQGGTGVLPGGSLRIRAHARPAAENLAAWPFPLTAKRDGRGGTLVLPAAPTASELSGALDTLAEVARWSDEPSATVVQVGSDRLPDGHLLLLARPGQVPTSVQSALDRPDPAGTLASVRQDGRLVTLAVGVQALAPLRHGVYPGRIDGSVAWVSPTGALRIVAGANPLKASAVVDDGAPWRWPVALIVLGGGLLVLRGLWGAQRSLAKRDKASGPPAGSSGVGAPATDPAVAERLAAWRARHDHPAT